MDKVFKIINIIKPTNCIMSYILYDKINGIFSRLLTFVFLFYDIPLRSISQKYKFYDDKVKEIVF